MRPSTARSITPVFLGLAALGLLLASACGDGEPSADRGCDLGVHLDQQTADRFARERGTLDRTVDGVLVDRPPTDLHLATDGPVIPASWAASAGGSLEDHSRGIALSAGGTFLIGSFGKGTGSGTASFGALSLSSAGGDDVFVAKLDSQGKFVWATPAGGAQSDQGVAIAVDGSGYVVVAGRFSGTVSFGTTTLTSKGLTDIFVAKLDPAGSFMWALGAGGAGDDSVSGLALDASKNIYLAGSFGSTTTAAPSTAIFGGKTLTTKGYSDAFVAKVSSAGGFGWVVQGGGPLVDGASAIAVDSSSNLRVTGSFAGTASFGSTSLISAGGRDIFVAMLDQNGSCLWSKGAGGAGDDAGAAIAAGGGGSAVLTGSFSGTVSFGATSLKAAGKSAIFVARIDSAGLFQWASGAGGPDADAGTSLALDSGGNAYVTGRFSGTTSFGTTPALTASGTSDAFVAKLDSKGKFLWSTRAGGSGVDSGVALAVDSAGRSHVTGDFAGTASFGAASLKSKGSTEVFVAKLDPSGKLP